MNHFTKNCLAALAAVALLLATADVVHAQGRDRGPLRAGNVAAVQLLTIDAVQADLKLTDDQKTTVKAIHEEFRTGRREVFAASTKESGERGPKIKELMEKIDVKISEALDETQQGRLRQIMFQVNGAAMLENEDVAAELMLTDEQKAQLEEVRKLNAKERREALKALADTGGDRRQKLAELQQEADKRLLEVLTAEQRAQFVAMQGEKLELDLFAA